MSLRSVPRRAYRDNSATQHNLSYRFGYDAHGVPGRAYRIGEMGERSVGAYSTPSSRSRFAELEAAAATMNEVLSA